MIKKSTTLLSLTPKTNFPGIPSEYKPISHKIVGKIAAFRIKPHLESGKIGLETPICFIPERQITDYSHEIMHTMKITKRKSGYMSLKLDPSKAFNRLEWSFIIRILTFFDFNSDFCG